jgi:hypothetical protein
MPLLLRVLAISMTNSGMICCLHLEVEVSELEELQEKKRKELQQEKDGQSAEKGTTARESRTRERKTQKGTTARGRRTNIGVSRYLWWA